MKKFLAVMLTLSLLLTGVVALADETAVMTYADYVAAEIAGALHAEKLLLLTDIEGVYKDFNDKDSFISSLTVEEAKGYIKDGTISGGMIPKIEACLKSIECGTNKVHIIDGRQPHSIILELLTNSGIGTQVVK